MSQSLTDTIAEKRIIVCVGSGGVGKTTTAAALALQSARGGKRTLVLTIDPAKRLASSLGLAELGHDVMRVADDKLDAAGPRQQGGELHAMMLDQKRAFDEMVARYASDAEAVKRILQNPVYEQISGSLAGSQEYAAMTKVHELHSQGLFDVIVVDTPPTSHALDFLDAPQKLTNAIDSPAIDWFRQIRSGKRSTIGRTGSYVLKRLAKFVGSKFFDDLAIFFTEFNDILGGFRARAEQTFELLQEDIVGFVLVASPEPMAVQEALYFHERLRTKNMPFAGFVVNKVHLGRPLAADKATIVRSLENCEAVAQLQYHRSTLQVATEALLETHAELELLAHIDRRALARFRETGGDCPVAVVPFFDEDIHHVAKLGALSGYFAGTIPATQAS